MGGGRGVGGGPRSWLAGMDMYRKVPVDLLESTKEGNVVSILVFVIILVLVSYETNQFFSTKLVTDLALDPKRKGEFDKVQVKFNITMMDLKCKVSTVDMSVNPFQCGR